MAVGDGMGVRVSDDDRPGFAILDFGREIAPGDVLIALKSKRLRPDEFVDNSGKWSKTPFMFRAVKRTEAAGTYLIGPEIVNHDFLAHDLIEVAVQNSTVVEELDWPELTPNPKASPLTTTIFRPELPPTEKPVDQASEATGDTGKADEPQIAPAAPPKEQAPPKRRFLPWTAAGGLGAVILLLFATSWFFCTPFPFVNGQCSAPPGVLTEALACAESMGPGRPCEAAQCFDRYFAIGPVAGPDRTSAENTKGMFSQACGKRHADYESAKSCAKGKERTDPCGARQCLSGFLASNVKVPGIDAEAGTLAADLDLKCKTDDDAAAQARSCLAQSKTPPCDKARRCLHAYLSAARDNPAHKAELTALAGSNEAECNKASRYEELRQQLADQQKRQDDAKFKSAQDCEAATGDCAAKKSCYDGYISDFPKGSHIDDANNRTSQIQCAPPPPASGSVSLRNGTYSARTKLEPSCSTALRSVTVRIKNGTIAWKHNITPDLPVSWDGTIDAQGFVQARAGVNGTKATGRLTDDGTSKEIEIVYPQCDKPIQAQVIARIE